MKLPASVAFSSVYWYFEICGALGLLDHGTQVIGMVWVYTGRGVVVRGVGLGVGGTGEWVGN